jgi:hypothetical protein
VDQKSRAVAVSHGLPGIGKDKAMYVPSMGENVLIAGKTYHVQDIDHLQQSAWVAIPQGGGVVDSNSLKWVGFDDINLKETE